MMRGENPAGGSQPKPLVVGLGVLLLIAGAWYGLDFPLQPYPAQSQNQRHLAILCLRVLQIAFLVPLLQIAVGFVLSGKNAAADVRCHTCVFSVVVTLIMLICVPMVIVWHPITYFDLNWNPYGLGTWHIGRHVFLLCVVPLLAGVCAHSVLYLISDLRRLTPTLRNRVAVYGIVATLALGSSGAAMVVSICARIQIRETLDYREAYVAAWQETDKATKQFVEERPGDYHFLLLRANYLQDAGQTNEAQVMYGQVCDAIDTPEGMREFISKAEIDPRTE